jgi:hypothetical protein
MHQGARGGRQPGGRATGRARVGGRHPAVSRMGPRAAAHTGEDDKDIRITIRNLIEETK